MTVIRVKHCAVYRQVWGSRLYAAGRAAWIWSDLVRRCNPESRAADSGSTVLACRRNGIVSCPDRLPSDPFGGTVLANQRSGGRGAQPLPWRDADRNLKKFNKLEITGIDMFVLIANTIHYNLAFNTPLSIILHYQFRSEYNLFFLFNVILRKIMTLVYSHCFMGL